MKFRRIVNSWLAPLVMAAFATFYVRPLTAISQEYGFWFLLPVWSALMVGLLTIFEWLSNRLAPKDKPSDELYNANFPKPAVLATDWDDWLQANEDTLREAFKSAGTGRHKGLVILTRDNRALTATKTRKGWDVFIQSVAEPITRIPTPLGSKWAGKETIDGSIWQALFKRTPSGTVSDAEAMQIARHVLGMGELPETLAWYTIQHPAKDAQA